nr:peptidoglycan bridge formation glycyltransferase FemA/FemB family protein [Nitrospirota bacterium]
MLVEWVEWTEQEAAVRWDAALSTLPGSNIFQSHQWGELKRSSGWTPSRWSALQRNGSTAGMVQILMKPVLPGLWYGWAPGGPVCSFGEHSGAGAAVLIAGLIDALKVKGGTVYVRFDSHVGVDGPLTSAFQETLVRPLCRLNSGYALELSLPPTMDEFLEGLSSKHRYYVKKALKEKLEWRAANDRQSVEELARLNAEMVENKRQRWLARSEEDIAHFCRLLGDAAVIFTGYSGGTPVVSCLILVYRHQAFYWMAAAGAKGRALGASYAMIYRLVEYLLERKITDFNFGGIAPGSNQAEGVNHFKRGFGGKIIENLGEWEYGSSAWVRCSVNLGIWYRSKIKGMPELAT